MSKILCVLLFVSLVYGCKDESKYKQELRLTLIQIDGLANGSDIWVDAISDVWKKAIYDKEYLGKYCSDYNYAVTTHANTFKSSDSYKTLKEKSDEIKNKLIELKDYPSKYKEAYDAIVDLYIMSDQLLSYAKDPKGSLLTYNKETIDLYSDIQKREKVFKIKYLEEQ